jgi:membrane protein implicated in regulation of membrane protease activity
MIHDEFSKNRLMYKFLILGTIASVGGFHGWRTIFANFAVQSAGIDGFQMGVIQSLREIPGFLAFTVVFILVFMKEHVLSALSLIIVGVWVAITGFFPSFTGIIITTFIMSIGFHYQETVNQSLLTQYFSKSGVSLFFGKIRSVAAITNICIGGMIWILALFMSMEYMFLVLGIVVTLIAVYMLKMKPHDESMPPQKMKIVIKKKYWLYYALNFLAGSRRQIFVVFSVFLLVEYYHLSVQWMTALFVIANTLNYFLSIQIGRWMNILGEKRMLSIEYISLFVIFLVYAFVENYLVAAFFYVLDQLFFNFAIGIQTYFKKTADHEDIAPSTAVGFTINHISAIIVPVIGGLLWVYNWKIPFVFGAFLSLVSLYLVQKIVIPVESKGEGQS